MKIQSILQNAGGIIFFGALAIAQATAQEVDNQTLPIYDDLGELAYEITANPEAQEYFNQGLRLYYAFNHAEAIASFSQAQQLDPECAMCWWGEALAWGPNINLPMDQPSGLSAFSAIEQAQALANNANDKEQKLIEALAKRYQKVPVEDRGELDLAYSTAMQRLAEQYPEDDNIVVLSGESVMDLSPWDYWEDANQPRPGMDRALAGFQAVMNRSEDHPGACHFYIHAVEEVQPELAVPCAEKLRTLMPGAGHLVHMPGHIYIRVGRYLDAIRVNEHAVHADESWIQDRKPEPGMYTVGYYPHNYDFLAFAAMMIGRGNQSIEAADKMAAVIPEQMLHDPSMTFPQHYAMRSALLRVRFGRWQEIQQLPAPGEDLPHAQAIWEYAQGRAMVANGNVPAAKNALQRLHTLATGERLADARLEFNASQKILGIAENVLAGRIAAAEEKFDTAIGHLRAAMASEDTLLYGEPPEWSVGVRQELGEVLLTAGRPAEAEQAFRNDLRNFPENAWSLAGVANALKAQRENEAAEEFETRFNAVWSGEGTSPMLE